MAGRHHILLEGVVLTTPDSCLSDTVCRARLGSDCVEYCVYENGKYVAGQWVSGHSDVSPLYNFPDFWLDAENTRCYRCT